MKLPRGRSLSLFIARAALAVLLPACPAGVASADSKPSWPPLDDIVSKVRTALPALPAPSADSSSSDAASYIRSLSPWVLLPLDSDSAPIPSPVGKSVAYTGAAGYVRVADVSSSLPEALRSSIADLQKSGPLSGLILDLRFAGGTNFQAAMDAASVLAAKDGIEFRLGGVSWRTLPSEPRPSFPVFVLINRQTREAAELLAAAVRASASKPLVVGTNSAGQARAYRSLAVSDQLSLRISDQSITLPDGSEFPTLGVRPDLPLSIPEADERAYATNEYQRVLRGSPVAASRMVRMNEAELVRQRRQPRPGSGEEPDQRPSRRRSTIHPGDTPPTTRGLPPDAKSVQDPALGVAIDLINGSAVEAAPAPSPGPQ